MPVCGRKQLYHFNTIGNQARDGRGSPTVGTSVRVGMLLGLTVGWAVAVAGAVAVGA